MAAGDLRASLEGVLKALEDSRQVLAGGARPKAEEVERMAAMTGKARESLAAAVEAAGDMAPGDRLEVLRLVQEIRNRMGVVARLAHGSAWFASLVRELDPSGRPKGTYGRDGAVEAPSPSVERRA